MKHSAARTVVEQAADTRPMIKGMKANVKEMESPNASNSKIFHFLEAELLRLQCNNELILSSHKRYSIIVTLFKLPAAMSKSFSVTNVMKGFVLNGQLDK